MMQKRPVLMLAVMLALLVSVPVTAADDLRLDTFIRIAERHTESVVNISTRRFSGGSRVAEPTPEGERDLPRPDRPRGRRQTSLGSGFFLDATGMIATNAHVVRGADEVVVRTARGDEYPADVMGLDPQTDLAVLRITPRPGDRFVALALGDSDRLRVGEFVVAIGSPFGLRQSISVGVVSAVGRSLNEGPYDDYIQTDAAINVGNSGGPLLNVEGAVVGVNTAILRDGVRIGFAVPINQAKPVFDQLRASGRVVRGWLGVSPQDVTPDLVQAFRLDQPTGIVIASLVKDQPAEKSGLHVGDVVLRVDGRPIRHRKDLFRIVAETPVGRAVPVDVVRKGQAMTLTVTVGERPSQPVTVPSRPKVSGFGLTVKEVPAEQRGAVAVEGGVLVDHVEPGSLADQADLSQGDVILQVNGAPVASLDSFRSLLEEGRKEGVVVLYVKHGDAFRFVPLRTPTS